MGVRAKNARLLSQKQAEAAENWTSEGYKNPNSPNQHTLVRHAFVFLLKPRMEEGLPPSSTYIQIFTHLKKKLDQITRALYVGLQIHQQL